MVSFLSPKSGCGTPFLLWATFFLWRLINGGDPITTYYGAGVETKCNMKEVDSTEAKRTKDRSQVKVLLLAPGFSQHPQPASMLSQVPLPPEVRMFLESIAFLN